jgi:hypothetical protein
MWPLYSTTEQGGGKHRRQGDSRGSSAFVILDAFGGSPVSATAGEWGCPTSPRPPTPLWGATQVLF